MRTTRAALGLGLITLASCGDLTADDPEAGAEMAVTRAQLTLTAPLVPGQPLLCASIGSAPRITAQPRDAHVQRGRVGVFAVSVVCPSDAAYQWRRNGVAIGGATAATFTTAPTVQTDDGAIFDVELRSRSGFVGGSSVVLSRGALLDVLAPNDGACAAGNRLGGGGAHSLALKADGRVYAWGGNLYGEIGNGAGGVGAPLQLAPLRLGAPAAAGSVVSWGSSRSSFAIDQASGRVWAWGFNDHGQIGDGTLTHRPSPVLASFVSDALSVATGDQHTLAATGSGTTQVWGINTLGQLGDGTSITRTQAVPSAIAGAVCVAGSLFHSLALQADGSVWGWGENGWGQLGTGTPSPTASSVVTTPARALLPAGTRVVALATARDDVLALTDAGQVYRWGRTYGATPQLQPGLPAASPVVAIAAGYSHFLALLADGRVYAWGANVFGQLGIGTTTAAVIPAQVIAPLPATTVAIGAGQYHSLALASDGSVWSWGNNTAGQLGDGTTAMRSSPVRVGAVGSWLNLN